MIRSNKLFSCASALSWIAPSGKICSDRTVSDTRVPDLFPARRYHKKTFRSRLAAKRPTKRINIEAKLKIAAIFRENSGFLVNLRKIPGEIGDFFCNFLSNKHLA